MSRQKPPSFVIKAVSIASLGGILFGYDLGVVSAALPQLANAFDLSDSQQEMVVYFLYLGGILGAALGGTVCDLFGRRKAILLTDILFLCGAIILFWSLNLTTILVGRIIVGFAVALSGIADVAYLHEISPVQWRGSIVSVNEACISLGFLISYITGYFVSLANPDNGWRYMFGGGSLIAMIQFVGMLCFMPESPVWLREKGRDLEASIVEQNCGLIATTTTSGGGNNSDTVTSSTATSISSETSLSERKSNGRIRVPTEEEKEEEEEDVIDSSSITEIPYEGKSAQDKNTMETNHNDVIQSEEEKATTNERTFAYTSSAKKYSALNALDKSDILSSSLEDTNSDERTAPPFMIDQNSNISFNYDDDEGQNPEKEEEQEEKSAKSLKEKTTNFLLVASRYYRQIIIAIFLSLAQQFCGHTNVLNFAPTIFNEVGFESNAAALVVTVILGVVKFIITCYVIWKIEDIGRRTFLLCGMAMMSISLILLTVAYEIARDENGEMYSGSKILALVGVFGVVGGYAGSFGPLTWLLVSELFPSAIRGRCLGGSYIFTYLGAALVSKTFLTWQDKFGPAIPFIFYGIITVFSMLFAHLALPDTAGKDADQIEEDMNEMPFWKRTRRRQNYSVPAEPEQIVDKVIV